MTDNSRQPLLKLKNISHTYDVCINSPQILENICLDIFDGEIVVLLGPSGCGKSTILRIVAGLLKATKGSVLFDGKDINMPSKERSMVSQNYACFPFLTVEDNIGFGLSLNGEDKNEQKEIVDELLKTFNLLHLRKSYPSTLSGGERQRVAIARSLAVNPKLLLMDEPFSSLDGVMRRQLQDLVLKLSGQKGRSFLFVTHSSEESVYLGNVIYVMSAGPTQAKDTPARLIGRVPVSLPKNRTQDIKSEADFEIIERKVNELLRKKAYE